MSKAKKPEKFTILSENYRQRNQTIDEYEPYLKMIKQIVIEDVPHQYQKRLLEVLK